MTTITTPPHVPWQRWEGLSEPDQMQEAYFGEERNRPVIILRGYLRTRSTRTGRIWRSAGSMASGYPSRRWEYQERMPWVTSLYRWGMESI